MAKLKYNPDWVDEQAIPYNDAVNNSLQTRGDPPTQFIARLRPLLRTSISVQVRVVRLVTANDISGVREDRLSID